MEVAEDASPKLLLNHEVEGKEYGIEYPHSNDVLCGRGGKLEVIGRRERLLLLDRELSSSDLPTRCCCVLFLVVTTNRHPGNEQFRRLVGLNKVRFLIPVECCIVNNPENGF